jgi:hypothetical protein
MADAPGRGLPDDEVRDLIGRLEPLLEQIEQATGPIAELAVRAVETLATVYGTALGRVMALAGGTPLVSSLAEDELLHHLLVLHGLHPRPAAERIRRALDDLGDVELVGVEDGVARLRWSRGARRCGSSALNEQAITDAVLAAAPELRDVRTEPAPGRRGPAAIIPAESLLRRPGGPA